MAGQLVKSALTVDEVYENYFKHELKGKPHADRFRQMWSMHAAPHFGHLVPADVSYEDVLKLRDSTLEVPTSGNMVIKEARRVFVHAQRMGQLPPGNTVISLLRLHKLEPKRTFLTLEEVRMVLEEAGKLTGRLRLMGIMIRALIVTGARLNELARSKYIEMLDDTTLLLPEKRAKSGRQRFLYPPPEFVEVLKLNPESMPFYSTLSKRRWYKFTESIGMPDLKIHDLRRVVGTIATLHLDAPIRDVSSVLGHADEHVTRIYLKQSDRQEKARELVSRVMNLVDDQPT